MSLQAGRRMLRSEGEQVISNRQTDSSDKPSLSTSIAAPKWCVEKQSESTQQQRSEVFVAKFESVENVWLFFILWRVGPEERVEERKSEQSKKMNFLKEPQNENRKMVSLVFALFLCLILPDFD
jgi:hypothetical protein